MSAVDALEPHELKQEHSRKRRAREACAIAKRRERLYHQSIADEMLHLGGAVTHTILYLGNLDRSFCDLRGDTSTYVNASGRVGSTDVLSEKVDGISFGCMQRSDEFYVVRVGSLVLRAPVLLIPERHTDGKWFGPSASHFGDDSAARLLVDIMIANPEYRDVLGRMLRSLPLGTAD